jgi:adenylate kinase family enzyme
MHPTEAPPKRVSVVGSSGSGKTTLACRLAAAIGAPHLELDAVNHQPDWQQLPQGEFTARVSCFVEGDSWVVDGNYSSVLPPIVWRAADTIVWLDLPRWKVTHQLVWRSVKRAVTRQELWNGNRESVRNLLSWDPQKSVIRWSWTHHKAVHRRYTEAMSDRKWQHIRFVRLTSHRQADDFLRGLELARRAPA